MGDFGELGLHLWAQLTFYGLEKQQGVVMRNTLIISIDFLYAGGGWWCTAHIPLWRRSYWRGFCQNIGLAIGPIRHHWLCSSVIKLGWLSGWVTICQFLLNICHSITNLIKLKLGSPTPAESSAPNIHQHCPPSIANIYHKHTTGFIVPSQPPRSPHLHHQTYTTN